MFAKKQKLSDQFDDSELSRKSQIFNGIHIYVNGFTGNCIASNAIHSSVPTASEIRAMLIEHGGTFEQYYSKSAGTFMVASVLPAGKIKKLTGDRVVRANWITDR